MPYYLNPRAARRDYDAALREILSLDAARAARTLLAGWNALTPHPAPLVALPALAATLGVAALDVKDESARSTLGSFKALGAPHALLRLIERRLAPRRVAAAELLAGAAADALRDLVAISATDGNHGRAVAWAARRLGQRAVIFVPGNTVAARIEAIQGEGAEVVVVPGSYDETVRRAAAEAERNGWQVISDTAYPGYTEIPGWIMEGYGTIFEEAARQLAELGGAEPSLVLLQAGVGGLACAGSLFYWWRGRRPTLVAVEPTDADCLLESAASPDGSIREAKGRQDSIMAGLNCGTPSLLAWPLIRDGMDAFLAVDDDFAREAMRLLASGEGGDPAVVSGESGAAGLAGLLALASEASLAEAREALGLRGARVLLVSTEGATDPPSWERIVGRRP